MSLIPVRSDPDASAPQEVVPNAGLPGDDALALALSHMLGEAEPVTIVNRKPRFEGTFPKEIVTCRVGSRAELQLFCKYGIGHVNSGRGHRGGVPREAFMYEHILSRTLLPLPGYVGSWVDTETGVAWLVIAYLAGSTRLHKADDRLALQIAARWIGTFHREFDDHAEVGSFLPAHGPEYYQAWATRLGAFAEADQSFPDWTRTLIDGFRRHASMLTESRTIVHGEYYPKNILYRDSTVYPVDWESASLGAGEIDLASLTDGWGENALATCSAEYAAARWPGGTPTDFPARLAVAQLYVHLRWLGDHPDSRTATSARLPAMKAVGASLGWL